MNKSSVSAKLISYVEERILSGEYAVGYRIPSMRRLANKFHVSYSSAIRAIDFLAEQGKLIKSPKRGVYVKSQLGENLYAQKYNGRKIFFITPFKLDGDFQSLWYNALEGVTEKANENSDEIIIKQVPLDENCNKFIQQFADSADGMIIFHSSYLDLSPLPNHIVAVGALLDDNLNNTVSVLNIDPVDAAHTAVKYFKNKNIKHIIIVSSPQNSFVLRGQIFAALWQNSGGTFELQTTLPDDYYTDKGYFFTSDHICQQAHIKTKTEKKFLIYRRTTVLSVDGKRFMRPDFFDFPTIALNWRVLGHCMYRELVNLMENPSEPKKNIYLTGKLHS